MPSGRANIRQQQRQSQETQQERMFEAVLFGGEEQESYPHPETNSRLHRTADTLNAPIRGQLGMVASEVISEPKRIRINFGAGEEPIRVNERVPAPNLSTIEDVSGLPFSQETRGKTTRLTGEFPVSVQTALVVKKHLPGQSDSYRVWAFRKPHHDFVKGQSGPVGLAERLPRQQAIAEVVDEHLLIGTKAGTKQEVIVMVTDKADNRSQRHRIEKVVRQMAEPLQRQLMQLQRNPQSNKEAIGQVANQLKYIMKYRPIVPVKERAVPDFDRQMQTIEAKLNGESQQVKGYVSQGPANMINIIKPVVIDPREAGIDVDSLVSYDATGLERPQRLVERSGRDLSDGLNRILDTITSHRGVQAADKSVALKFPLEARILHSPLAVPPEFN